MPSEVQDVEEYLASLPEDRREAITAIRESVLENLILSIFCSISSSKNKWPTKLGNKKTSHDFFMTFSLINQQI